MSLEGSLENAGVVDALRAISAFGYSGLLTAHGVHDLITVTFEGGAATAADAMNNPMDEALGEVLAQEGLLAPAEFRPALDASRESGSLVSSEILARGLVERAPLLKALRAQTYRQLLDVLRMREGQYSFAQDVESPSETGVEPLSVAEILVRSADDLGFEGPMVGQPPEIDSVIEPTGATHLEAKVLGRDGRQIVPGDDVVWLTDDESRLLDALSEPKAASLLLMELDLDQHRIRYGLHHLMQAGLLRESNLSVSSPLHSGMTPSTPLLQSDIDSKLVAQIRELDGGEAISYGEEAEEPIRFDESILEDPESAEPAPSSAFADLTLPPLDEPAPAADSDEAFAPSVTASLPDAPRVSQAEVVDTVALWFGRVLGVAFVALVLSLMLTGAGRSRLLFPYSWEADDRQVLEASQLVSVYNRIDDGVRTYHLLYGMYPEELRLLVDLELMQSRDRFGPGGQYLSFVSEGTDYEVRPESARAEAQAQGAVDGVRHDFFLNPRMTEGRAGSSRRPLFLID